MARRPSASLYVRNLSKTTTEVDLMKAFNGCIKTRIICNAETGESMW